MDTRKSFKIALSRFENSYYDIEDEDKLIDYLIAFEALFTKGKKERSKSKVISVECAKLLGIDHKEKEEIREKLSSAYTIRNDIIHGEDFEEELDIELFFNDFVEEIEELLRISLRKLV